MTTITDMIVDDNFVQNMGKCVPVVLKNEPKIIQQQFCGINILVENDRNTRWAMGLAMAASGRVVAVLKATTVVVLDKPTVAKIIENFDEKHSVVIKSETRLQ